MASKDEQVDGPAIAAAIINAMPAANQERILDSIAKSAPEMASMLEKRIETIHATPPPRAQTPASRPNLPLANPLRDSDEVKALAAAISKSMAEDMYSETDEKPSPTGKIKRRIA